MPDILDPSDATGRFAMPFLHAAQAHKEIFVNEALAIVDTILHCRVLGERSEAPVDRAENDSWLVAPSPSGAWAGHPDEIATYRGGQWSFTKPVDGLRAFDVSRGAEILFFGYWRKPAAPVEPLGGTSVDGEARTAIKDLVSALQALGILPLA